MQINERILFPETIKQIGRRLWFVLLLTAVAVFFSEKAYWYPSGLAIGELLFFYGVPVYVCLWLADYFKINSLATVVLLAGFYAFLIEGVLTPVIFEAGLFDPIMPAYFVGWHGLFAIVLGWYYVRQWLVEGRWGRLLFGSLSFGLLWGLWSITYWSPEQAMDWTEAVGPMGSVGTVWTVAEFGLYAFLFAGMFIVSHLFLGWGGWLAQFKPTKFERWLLLGLMLFFFATLSVPGAPFGFLKLVVLLTAVYFPLSIHRKRTQSGSLLQQLDQSIHKRGVLLLILMPVAATAVYGLAAPLQADSETLLFINEMIAFFQVISGGGLFIWAWIKTVTASKTARFIEAVG